MSEPAPVMAYATPAPRASSYWGAAILCLTGVAMMVVAGCFLIGVLLVTESNRPWTTRQTILSMVLYGMGFLSAGAAAALLVIGTRRALK